MVDHASTNVQRPCPLCASQEAIVIADLNIRDFDGVELTTRIQPVACAACGFVYNELPFKQNALNQFYAEASLYSATVGVGSGGDGPLDQTRYADMYARLAPFLSDQTQRIVDVGCAKGGFLAYLKGKGYSQLAGLDLSPTCVEYIRETHGCEAYVGGATELSLPGPAPDVMLFSHVLEHLFDPLATLRQAARKLSATGHIYIEVPDAGGYAADPVFDCYWFTQREHINHFDAPSLVAMCGQAGLRIIASGACMLALSVDTPTPVIYVIAQLDGDTALHPPQLRTNLTLSMQNYVAQERARLDARNKQLDELLSSQRPTYVWGIGLEFFYLYSQSELARCNIIALIDNNPAKRAFTVAELPILGSEHVPALPERSAVVITSALHHKAIYNWIQENGYSGTILTLACL